MDQVVNNLNQIITPMIGTTQNIIQNLEEVRNNNDKIEKKCKEVDTNLKKMNNIFNKINKQNK